MRKTTGKIWTGARLPEVGDELGGYRLERLLGKGAMGAVFEAKRLSDGIKAALKVMFVEEILADPDEVTTLRKRFVQEARLLSQVEHPGLPKIYDASQEDERPYFAMELLDGQDLAQRLTKTPALSVRNSLGLGISLAETLHHVYQETGAIHRDLKPANLFLLDDERVKLLDFGIAKVLESNDGTALQTRTGMAIGTLRYMAPEQHVAGTVDVRTDVFALGAIVFQLLAFRLPYKGRNVLELYDAKMRGPQFSVDRYARELPKSAVEMIHAMLAPEPADRPTDYVEIVATLRGARAALPPGRPTQRAVTEEVRAQAQESDELSEDLPTLQEVALSESLASAERTSFGTGTMGVTYGIQNGDDGITEIVCALRPEWATAACLKRLAETAANLQKSKVKGVIPWQVDAKAKVLRSPYVGGPTGSPLDLDQVCRNQPGGRLPEGSVAKLGLSLLAMLHHLHEAGLVHGNLKPQNVLFHYLSNAEGRWRTRPRLVGAAMAPAVGSQRHGEFIKERTTGEVGRVRTVENRAAHDSLAFMSPERLAGAPASARSDVYSLARLLLRAISGSSDPQALLRLAELAPAASSHWAPILGKAMREDPRRRFDAAEMAEYVHAIIE